jgi:hypothetical protein
MASMDREGYGYGETQPLVDRLLGDLRTLGPSGIERIAGAFATADHQRFHERERQALHQVHEAGRSDDWENLKADIHHLTDGGGSLLSWRSEHGETGHRAEAAVLGGALALLALALIPRPDFDALTGPLAEALPWVHGVTSEGRVEPAPDPE